MSRLSHNERTIVVSALKHATPYMRMYKRKIFVLKAGGEAFSSADTTRSLMEQVGLLHQVGIRVVLVHGGGAQSTQMAEELGITAEFVDGRRVTDQSALEITAMVLNGQINTRILASCRDLGIPAVGISGVDAGLIKAHKRPPVARQGSSGETVDYGFVGDIESVDTNVLIKQLDNDLVPIISPLSADESGTLLNINADSVASAVAVALSAEKLILATGAPGILESANEPASLISYVDLAGLSKLRNDNRLSDGMLPKVAAIELALLGGVPRVHVISHALPDSVLLEIFTNEGTGTLVVNDTQNLTPEEQQG